MHDETPACIEFDDACVKRGGRIICNMARSAFRKAR